MCGKINDNILYLSISIIAKKQQHNFTDFQFSRVNNLVDFINVFYKLPHY